MSSNTLFHPKAFPIRDPLDKKKNHGRVVNPPRMAEMGGLNSVREPRGPFKNDMTLRKPGDPTSGSKK